MMYQDLYLGDPPYLIGYRQSGSFPLHCHPEIELYYCTEGSYLLRIDQTEYFLKKGDLAIIGSMVPHELPESDPSIQAKALVLEVGPVMLGNYFQQLAGNPFSHPMYFNLQESHRELFELLEETEYLRENPTPFSNLMIRGNLYKIFAYILKDCTAQSEDSHRSKKMMSVLHVETALEHIRNNYAQPIPVEEVATLCGYSKSNFCKIFKQITGQTFHAVLNDHRLRVACTLLREAQLSVEQIALQVGFSDAKSFCRGFKAVYGISPGEYRKQQGVR